MFQGVANRNVAMVNRVVMTIATFLSMARRFPVMMDVEAAVMPHIFMVVRSRCLAVRKGLDGQRRNRGAVHYDAAPRFLLFVGYLCDPAENRTRIKGLGNLRSIH